MLVNGKKFLGVVQQIFSVVAFGVTLVCIPMHPKISKRLENPRPAELRVGEVENAEDGTVIDFVHWLGARVLSSGHGGNIDPE